MRFGAACGGAGAACLLTGCTPAQETAGLIGFGAGAVFLLAILAAPPIIEILQRREHHRRMYRRRPFSSRPPKDKRWRPASLDLAPLDLERKRNRVGAMDVALSILTVSRPETTLAVTRGAGRLMAALGYAPLAEVGLPNGRRADIMALGRRGEIAIVEVKSGPQDYLADRKWCEYLPFCDAYYFAVAPEFPRELLPREPGLIVADGFGGAVLRDAPSSPLAPARRKALTLAFARLAAGRAAI